MSNAEQQPQTTTKKFDPTQINTYKIPQGKLFSILPIVFGSVLRTGSGLFVDGYSVRSVKEDEKDGYLPFKALGFEGYTEYNTKISNYKRPEKPLELYEYEACPFCRRVREALSILDLDAVYYPTPRGCQVHRSLVKEKGGKELFPYLVDPNTGVAMYESKDIVEYLFKEYGDGKVSWTLSIPVLSQATLAISTLIRLPKGFSYRKAKYPEEHLIFWGYEGSPFCKLVRDVLTELELPHLFITCARGSDKRQELFEKVGAFQAPYLEDPNTRVSLFESDKIMKYLEETYALES